MTLSYINKLLFLFLALAAIPSSFVGILLLNEANNMANDSEENIDDLGTDVINITTEALKIEAESYLANKLNETKNKISDYLYERKRDCRVLSNISRTEEAFLGFYQANDYVKIAYINSSGYENITVENNQITTNNTNLLNATGYFQGAFKLPQGEVFIDNSELKGTTSKHVIRYCANASDGIVLVELNVSNLEEILYSVSLRGESNRALVSTAEFTEINKEFIMIVPPAGSNYTRGFSVIPGVDEIESFSAILYLLGGESPFVLATGQKTILGRVSPVPPLFGNFTSGYLTASTIAEDRIMVSLCIDEESFLAPANETSTVIEGSLSDSIDDMQSSRDSMLITSIILIATSIGLAVVGALVVGKRLTKRLKDLTETAIRINKGDIDVEVPHRGKDEIGQLAEAFEGLQDGMKYLMQEK